MTIITVMEGNSMTITTVVQLGGDDLVDDHFTSLDLAVARRIPVRLACLISGLHAARSKSENRLLVGSYGFQCLS